MTTARINGIHLAFDDSGGEGPAVLLVMGTGSPGRVWDIHQVPALKAAGYRTVTMTNRGIPPSDECPEGFTMEDMVGDVVGLIEHLGLSSVALIGTSLGARIVTETALARPDLVACVIGMAAHARLDPVQQAMTRGEIALSEQSYLLPPDYRAAVMALQYLSPATLRNEGQAQDWLDIMAFDDGRISKGHKAQLQISEQLVDRSDAYRGISVPMMIMAFRDDAAIPAYLSRELAGIVPGARYIEVPETGHYGYLEQPEAVNRQLLAYLQEVFPASRSDAAPRASATLR